MKNLPDRQQHAPPLELDTSDEVMTSAEFTLDLPADKHVGQYPWCDAVWRVDGVAFWIGDNQDFQKNDGPRKIRVSLEQGLTMEKILKIQQTIYDILHS